MRFIPAFLRKPAFQPVVLPDPIPLTSGPQVVKDSKPRNSKVAFEVEGEDGISHQVLFPTRTRHLRVEPQAEVFVLIYRDFGKAIRYIQLHGALRKEFGQKIPMWTVDINARDDDLMDAAFIDAEETMKAIRNPIEAKVVEPLTDVPHPAASHSHGVPVPTPVENGVPDVPMFSREGTYVGSGLFPWEGPQGQKSKNPSFAVLLMDASDNVSKLWGSDLERVIREIRVGDHIKLTKYPKMPFKVGNRVTHKNVWTCDLLEPLNASSKTRH